VPAGPEPEGAAEPDRAATGRVEEGERGGGRVADRVQAADRLPVVAERLAVDGDAGPAVGAQGAGLDGEGVERSLVDREGLAAAELVRGSGGGVGVEPGDAVDESLGVDADAAGELLDRIGGVQPVGGGIAGFDGE